MTLNSLNVVLLVFSQVHFGQKKSCIGVTNGCGSYSEGSLIKTRKFPIPEGSLIRWFVIPKVRLSENEIGFDIPKVR